MKKMIVAALAIMLGFCAGCSRELAEEGNGGQKEENSSNVPTPLPGENGHDTQKDENGAQETRPGTQEEKTVLPEYAQPYIERMKSYEEEHPQSECTYDLIYFDDDDIPELVAGVTGYYVSLYTYDSGNVYTLMEDWPYGAMGNAGYEYLPRQGILRNYNADLAGAIMYETYMEMGNGHELQDCYEEELSMWMFRDENHNYMIDEGEEDEDKVYFYYGEKEITEEMYETYQIKGEYEYIYGTKAYEIMKGELEGTGGGQALTAEELKAFEDYINRGDNYGFLLSVYDAPSGINLDEVFYCGAGLEGTSPGKEELQALKAAGWEEIYTDVTKITKKQAEEFLLKKTGLTYSEMKQPLSWTYLPEYDAYYFEHGDTNYTSFTCFEGSTLDGETFTLHSRGDSESWDTYVGLPMETVLKKSGDGYQFVSNRMMTEAGQIEEQSFDVSLSPLGDVVFASYEPDRDKNVLADANFRIIKNGSVYTTLSGVENLENIRSNLYFMEVAAVSFPDYNRDGFSDIIIIADYAFASGSDAGEPYREIRLYEGNEYGYFMYEKEKSDVANAALAEKTVESVKGFLIGH